MEIINRRKSLLWCFHSFIHLFILIRWEFLTFCFVRVSKREFWGISWSGSRGVTLVFKHADDFFKDLRKHGRLDLIFKSTGSVWISRVCRRTCGICLPHICPCSSVFNYPIRDEARFPDNPISRRQVRRECECTGEDKAGIWLCWVSWRYAVCQVSGVTGGGGGGRRRGVTVW